jgi:uncharacterized protein
MLKDIKDKHSDIEALCRKYNVLKLELFGSALTQSFQVSSDLDFLVTFQNMPPAKRAEAYFGLWFGLEDLFERKVDLIIRDAMQNPYLEREVTQTAQGLYAA